MEMSKKQYEYLIFAVVVALSVFRFSYFGLRYVPYLDDYVQYSYYPELENSWQRVYSGGAGVLFTRPLAGIFDWLIWSKFWNGLGFAVGIIAIVHGLSAVLFYKAFNLCGIRVGTLFLAIYTLAPINVEATYWLSASSRIVISMFFIALSSYFGANKRVFLFFMFNFLSMWFYEQTSILGFAVSVWICIQQKKRHWIGFPVISVVILAIFYLKFGFMGDNAHRMASASFRELGHGFAETFMDFIKILTTIQLKLLTRGFVRGFDRIAMDFSLLWLICLTVLAIIFFKLSQKCEKSKKKPYDVVWGILLIFAPILPFFLLKKSGFNMRNVAPCILGLAIIADSAISKISHKYICALGAVVVFWFSIVTVSEVGDYNFTAKQDLKLATSISDNVKPNTKTVEVRVTTPVYYTQNAPYRDHIMSITGSDWGLTGVVRTISGNGVVVINKVQ